MTNKEWLETIKMLDEDVMNKITMDKAKNIDNDLRLKWRQAKATEIIAEEFIKLNETINFALLHRDVMGLRKIFVEAFGEEEVRKAEKANEEKTKIQN